MNIILERQITRIMDLFHILHEDSNNFETFITQAETRSLSSLEEELLSQLPMYDNDEIEESTKKAISIAKRFGIEPDDQVIFEIAFQEDPEFGKQLKEIGMRNYQFLMQENFYEKVLSLFDKVKLYEFKHSYSSITPIKLGELTTACIEEYTYVPAFEYRAVLYHLLRHMVNITGEGPKWFLREAIKSAFEGKKILEIGSGPGFFLYFLREFGADVTGIDTNDTFSERVKKADLNILNMDAVGLTEHFEKDHFDVVISKDFLSFAVTRETAGQIMRQVYEILKPGGITLHQIEYRKADEEQYLKFIEKVSEKNKIDFEKIMKFWEKLAEEDKEFFLRKNILNISLEHLQEIGFTKLTELKLDCEDNISFVLTK